MESWSVARPVALPGKGDPLCLFDTSSQAIRPTQPQGTARMYVCGITPYDATHMGHAATYVAFDMVNRAWRDQGLDVDYVQNVTDIDDPLLERAVATGQDWREVALNQTDLFRDDMAALNVLPPEHYIGAVETIPEVVRYIQELQALGAVYSVDEDLYFSVRADPTFGSISHYGQDQMLRVFAERGGDPQRPGKRDPLDCLLWLSARPGEPAWDTELGHGRPGWHIECTAIALNRIGMGFDVQGGGSDLIFPHHEMGAAEAHVLRGMHPYAQHYVHAGMVSWQGHKMSKSRGNLVFVSTLRRQGTDPMAIRLALLAHHYRRDWAWTEQGLEGAQSRLALWRQAAGCSGGPDGLQVLRKVRAHLANDLATADALDVIDAWAMSAIGGHDTDADAPALVAQLCDTLLGVRL